MWILLAVGSALAWAGSNIADKYALTRLPRSPLFMTAVSSAGALLVGILSYLYAPFSLLPYLLDIAVFAVLFLLVNLFFLRALSEDEASRVLPLFELTTVFLLIAAVVFFHEHINLLQAGAACVILAGVYLLTRDPSRRKGPFRSKREVLFLLAAALMWTVYVLTARFRLDTLSFVPLLTVLLLSRGILVVVLPFARPKSGWHTIPKVVWFSAFSSGMFGAAGISFWLIAVNRGPFAFVTLLATLQYPFVFLLETAAGRLFPQSTAFRVSGGHAAFLAKSLAIALVVLGASAIALTASR